MTAQFEQNEEHAQTSMDDRVGTEDCGLLDGHRLERADVEVRTMPDVVHHKFEDTALLGSSTIANVDRCCLEPRRWFDEIRSAVECQRHGGELYFGVDTPSRGRLPAGRGASTENPCAR